MTAYEQRLADMQVRMGTAMQALETAGLDWQLTYGFSPSVRVGAVCINEYPLPEVILRACEIARKRHARI